MSLLEARRLTIQAELDSAKAPAERNRMGQFATPTELAQEILEYAKAILGETTTVRFIDPAIGTGSFFSALLRVFGPANVTQAVGYELDDHYGKPGAKLWAQTQLDIRSADFTQAQPSSDKEKFNLVICNPPYVRHHHITSEEKRRLKVVTQKACGVQMNGLAGLYCYFLGLCHQLMAEDGLAGWLIPSEFMDVNYGASVKQYLLDQVTLLHIHRFDPNEVQFGGALVSSSVVWFRKRQPPVTREVRMTFGGSLLRPRLERFVPTETLRGDLKWTGFPMKRCPSKKNEPMLADFFTIKRGLATGNNKYFILPEEDVKARDLPYEALRPILPSPRHLPENEVAADDAGNPVLNRPLLLLDCRLPEEEIKNRYPTLHAYLEEGKAQGVAERYLCRKRLPWYSQEQRPPAPFLCTYFGRSDKKSGPPFRFILNHSLATAANVYLMLYPKPELADAVSEAPWVKRKVWEFLCGIGAKDMLNEGRVYGGGLHKLEPKELGRVSAAALADLLPELKWEGNFKQGELCHTPIS